mmetsp:Transcript_28031/g.60866  ORF Transcript_28031/g.60866 Transcript_28031/m.60866 type:complete len:222 (-) Transcript_28031:442-1107(-)
MHCQQGLLHLLLHLAAFAPGPGCGQARLAALWRRHLGACTARPTRAAARAEAFVASDDISLGRWSRPRTPIVPLASEALATGPSVGALLIHCVLSEVALVLCPSGPEHPPPSMHVAVLPLPGIANAIGEDVAPLAVHAVALPLPLVIGAGLRAPGAGAVLRPAQEFALETGTVGPLLDAPPRLHGLAPLALVSAAVFVEEGPDPMRQVPIPLPHILQLATG